jgi:hypothetical protein
LTRPGVDDIQSKKKTGFFSGVSFGGVVKGAEEYGTCHEREEVMGEGN